MTTFTTQQTFDNAIRFRAEQFGQSIYGKSYGWQTEFAKALGFKSVQQLTNILKGSDSVGNKFLARLEKLGCDPIWLRTGNTKPAKKEPNVIRVPSVYQAKGGKVNRKQKQQLEDVLINRSADRSLYYFIAPDDSMSPVVNQGDIVIASEMRNFEHDAKKGKVLAIIFHSINTIIRYVSIQDGTVILTTANNNCQPSIIEANLMTDINRIVEIRRKL